MSNAKWVFTPLTEAESQLVAQLSMHPDLYALNEVALNYLVKKGYTDVNQIKSLLYDGLTHLHDIQLMQDAKKAIQIVQDSIEAGEEIVVYGDYDADGICGAIIGVEGLRYLGANVNHFTNNRFKEGYGINKKGLDRLLTLYPNTALIITVDNGISAHEGIDYANELGIKVVVTDHHEPGETLPNALAVLDAKRKDETYPFKDLCGAGLCFKFLCGLAHVMGRDLNPILNLIDVASLATVADMVPLLGENRIIVKEGLKLVNHEKRSAFRLLREASGIAQVDEMTYGFAYGPLLNAMGRLRGEVHDVIDFFLERDEEKQREMVQKLVEFNAERKEMTTHQVELGLRLAEKQKDEQVVILSHPDFHEGIVGLVAGRLKDALYRPVIVLTQEDGKIKGSARSIPAFHLKDALDKCAVHLDKYGGHAPAAGLTVQDGELEAFTEAIRTVASQVLTPEDLVPKVQIDLGLTPDEVTYELMDSLDVLRPFGLGFEKPTLGVKNFEVSRAFYMGAEKQHVKLCGDSDVSLVLWKEADLYKSLKEPKIVLALGYPELNTYAGKTSIQFTIKDNYLRAQGRLSR